MPKWLKIIVAVLALLLLVGAGTAGSFYVTSTAKLDATYPIPSMTLTIPTDEPSLEEGDRLLKARGCADCHAPDLGGKMEAMGPVGSFYAPNLTPAPGSLVPAMSDAELAGIIRHGVRASGAPILFMPAHEFWPMSDDEASKLIAALRRVPPVERPREPSHVGPVGHILNATDAMPIVPASLVDHTKPRPPMPPAPSKEFGEYLGNSCRGCHGATLSGGPIPGAPPELPTPTNITLHDTGLAKYDLASFITTMRTGTRPDGSALNPFMPFGSYKHMTDAELTAIWTFLEAQPKKPFGQR